MCLRKGCCARFVRVCSMDVEFVNEAINLVCYSDSDAHYLAFVIGFIVLKVIGSVFVENVN